MREEKSHRSLDRLIYAGIAPRRARRILREFSDHHADLVAEQLAQGVDRAEAEAAAGKRLGTEEQLVADVIDRPGLRCWSRRRPGVAFAVAPVLLFALSFGASLLMFIALVQWRKFLGAPLTGAAGTVRWISEYGAAYLLWGLPLAGASTLAAAAAHSRETSIWPGVGIVLICVVGALTNFSVDLAPLVQASSMTAGIGISTDHISAPLLRAAATAAPALLAYAWARHPQRREIDTLSS
jgi:hypothetical protein